MILPTSQISMTGPRKFGMRDLSRARQPKCNSQFSVHFLIKAANIPHARVTPNLLTVLPHSRCTLHSLYTTYDISALRADRLDRLDIDVHARAYTQESTCAISEYRSFDSPQNCPSRRRPRWNFLSIGGIEPIPPMIPNRYKTNRLLFRSFLR